MHASPRSLAARALVAALLAGTAAGSAGAQQPQCDIEDATVIAERIRERLEGESIVVDDACHRITISAGCAQFIAGESVDQFIGRADQALYAAKRNGRNRIERAA